MCVLAMIPWLYASVAELCEILVRHPCHKVEALTQNLQLEEPPVWHLSQKSRSVWHQDQQQRSAAVRPACGKEQHTANTPQMLAVGMEWVPTRVISSHS